ncbi:hypothetical protein HMPREF1551_00573 [Capnocytophaga sp. oral taxon 863 str. F0517]|nr:hypothetical protein HMPREF1551_00573 [Capnocytophaga sp. oral taxon 863 str. F0517]
MSGRVLHLVTARGFEPLTLRAEILKDKIFRFVTSLKSDTFK